jgi:hypothetical protein
MFDRFKLTHDGVAKVISCDFAPHRASTTSHGHTSTVFDLVVEVHPQGAAPFRAATQHSFVIILAPDPGAQLKVRCNPETKKVEIDTDGDPRYDTKVRKAARKGEREAQREADLNAPIGSAPAASRPDAAGLDPELAEILRLEQELKGDLPDF